MESPKFPAKTISFRDNNYPLLQMRSFNSLSIETINAIEMITLDSRYPPSIVGSFKYIVHEYPADIDLFETYHTCCNTVEAARDVTAKIKNIFKKIKNDKNTYLGDFKAGYDERYKIDIGCIKGSKLSGYNPFKIRSKITSIHEYKLLSNEDMRKWLNKVIDSPSVSEYRDLEQAIRSKYVVRWTLDDVLKGYVTLPFGKIFKLEDAIASKSIVKIDIWRCLNNRYVEITNWYMITYKDADGSTKYLTSKPGDYEGSLMKDIEHYQSEQTQKYMKLAKRLWNYAVLKKNKTLMSTLYPLFSSGASKMYQILGELETIQKILLKISKPHMDLIIANIEDWKTRIGTIMGDVLPIFEAHSIFTKIDKIIENKNNIPAILHSLEDIEVKLNLYVNRYVLLYFKRNRINAKIILRKANL